MQFENIYLYDEMIINFKIVFPGYRYELYCASKASKSTQCTVYTIRSHDDAWEDNLKRQRNEVTDGVIHSPSEGNIENVNSIPYTEEVFNALTRLRYLSNRYFYNNLYVCKIKHSIVL